jgi:hypothetical protein
MAFINPKYEIIFDDVYAIPDGTNTVYRAQIYKDGYSSATVYPLTASSSPFIIQTIDTEGNAYTPVLATRATLNIVKNEFQSTNYAELLQDFFTADDNDYMIVVTKGTYNGSYTFGTVIWRGFFMPVDSVQFSPVALNSLSLSFVDGLARTKNKKYYFNLVDGIGFNAEDQVSIKDLLIDCFSKTEFTLNVWVNEYYKTANVSSRNIENMYLKKNYLMEQYGEYINYYDILEYLCNRFGWECFYEEDKWYLTAYGALTRESTIAYYVYNSAGTFQSTQTVDNTISVAIDSTNNYKQVDQSLMVSFNRAQKSYSQFSPIYNVKQLITNGWFLSWSGVNNADAWIEAAMVGSKADPVYGGLLTTDTTNVSGETNKSFRSVGSLVKTGDYLNIRWSASAFNCTERYFVRIISDDNATTYYLDNTGTFTTTSYTLGAFPGGFPKQVIVPIDGTITVTILRPLETGATPQLVVEYFLIQNVGPTSQIYSYDSYREIGSINSEFKPTETENFSLGFMYNEVFRNTDSNARIANNAFEVTASSYVGMYTMLNNGGFANQFGRTTSGSTELFTLVAQDIGIDQVQTQTVIEGQFKSIGYWLDNKFTYSYDGVNTYTYLLKSFKWDLKQAIQESVLKKINYNGTTIDIDIFKNLNTRK